MVLELLFFDSQISWLDFIRDLYLIFIHIHSVFNSEKTKISFLNCKSCHDIRCQTSFIVVWHHIVYREDSL